MPSRRTIAITVAAGRGTRLGGELPKQYQSLSGRPLLQHAVERLAAAPTIDFVLPVIAGADRALFDAIAFSPAAQAKLLPAVPGGATRQISVARGLEAIADRQPDFVLIHDAARPLFSQMLTTRILEALEAAPAAIPALPLSDTLKRADAAGNVAATVPREGLHAVQTPQGFHFAAILAAHRAAGNDAFTDDAAVVEAAGLPVRLVPGEQHNIKITLPEDFAMAEWLLQHEEGTDTMAQPPISLSGQGFDVHRLKAGEGVWVCGLFLPCGLAAVGHSDADVGLHALTDALLGALGEGDIGQHFPPTDERWRGARSDIFFRHALDLMGRQRARLVHMDVTIICERPKIAPHREAMRAHLAELTGLALPRVSVKATTTEGLGFAGRGEGIAAQAIVTIAIG